MIEGTVERSEMDEQMLTMSRWRRKWSVICSEWYSCSKCWAKNLCKTVLHNSRTFVWISTNFDHCNLSQARPDHHKFCARWVTYRRGLDWWRNLLNTYTTCYYISHYVFSSLSSSTVVSRDSLNPSLIRLRSSLYSLGSCPTENTISEQFLYRYTCVFTSPLRACSFPR
jgi:hypothetical protein